MAKFTVVVDLAVEHDPDRAVLVRHRLGAALEVDDAQPPVPENDVGWFRQLLWLAEAGTTICKPPVPDTVRAAMSQRLGEPDHVLACRGPRGVGHDSRDAAHQRRLSSHLEEVRPPATPTLAVVLSFSVVVPATDAPTSLDECLRAIRAAIDPPHELIVVDAPTGAGPASARNLGVRQATGDVVVFVDSDVAVHSDAFVRVRLRSLPTRI